MFADALPIGRGAAVACSAELRRHADKIAGAEADTVGPDRLAWTPTPARRGSRATGPQVVTATSAKGQGGPVGPVVPASCDLHRNAFGH